MIATQKIHRYDDSEPGAWAEFLAARDSGEQVEIDEGMYWYWLGVLPPVWMFQDVTWSDGQKQRAHFGFAEGTEEIIAFWNTGSRFYCRGTGAINSY